MVINMQAYRITVTLKQAGEDLYALAARVRASRDGYAALGRSVDAASETLENIAGALSAQRRALEASTDFCRRCRDALEGGDLGEMQRQRDKLRAELTTR